jgi:DNA-binding FadR family transcriptional regulator
MVAAVIEKPTLPASTPSRPAFHGKPATRQRVADHVFESLARAILNGNLKAGEPLTTQRDLAREFKVSALVVRQAIHRLEDLGLVRVRQGSATIVLDPSESSDIRVIQLQLELAETGPGFASSVIELRSLFMLPMLVLAERRINEQELAVLRYLVDHIREDAAPADVQQFRAEFWAQISKATKNPLYQQQVRWWWKLSSKLERHGRDVRAPSGPLQLAFYRQMIDALARRQGAVQLHLESIKPVLEWADARKAKERR